MIRVAINGFGRIGRQILQAGINDSEIEWVAINDLTDNNTLAYLMKYDSVQYRETKDVKAKEDSIIVEGKEIKVFSEKDPENLPWKDLDIDIVIESTGLFTKREGAEKHLKAGAKKVLISAPSEDADFTVVKGVNEHDLKGEHKIISNASCTTNCVAPVAKVINDNFGIESSSMITVHAYTATQKLVDAPAKKDLRRGRSAAVNMIPTTTGAAKAVCKAIPELEGKMEAFAIRVPVPVGSIATITASTKKPATVEKVNELFKSVQKHHMKGVLQYSEEPLVSSDIIHNPHSCIVDAQMTRVSGENLISITAWYDNEWGYSNRMVDVVKLLKN